MQVRRRRGIHSNYEKTLANLVPVLRLSLDGDSRHGLV